MSIHDLISKISNFMRTRFDMREKQNRNYHRKYQRNLLEKLLICLKGKQWLKAASLIATPEKLFSLKFIENILASISKFCAQMIGENFQLELFPEFEPDGLDRVEVTEEDMAQTREYHRQEYGYGYGCNRSKMVNQKYAWLPNIFDWFYKGRGMWSYLDSLKKQPAIQPNWVQLSLWGMV